MEEFDSYNASMTLVPQPICLQPKTQKPPKLQTHANKTDIQDPSPLYTTTHSESQSV